jgi:hypothetical protein
MNVTFASAVLNKPRVIFLMSCLVGPSVMHSVATYYRKSWAVDMTLQHMMA